MRIGIDLGTTFSVAAQVKDGQSEVVPNREGARLTPSVVLVQEDGKVVVGDAAKEQAVIVPEGVVTAVKNYMGKQHSFHLSDGKDYTPEMISSFILRRLVEDVERFTGQKVDGAVVTIPAYFTDAQRKATEDAAKLAGLNLLGTINEPTAAAIYYASRIKSSDPQNIMVYDLGGGTFDVTIIRTQGMDVRVLSTHGLSGVGGKLFDQAIVDYVCEEFASKHDIDLEDDDYLDEYQELVLKAENCKIQLSSKDSAIIPLRVGKVKESITVTREFLENEVMKLYMRTEASIRKAIREAGISFESLDKVVLVGGSSKIPLIQHQIEKLLGRKPSMDVNPDEAVALGAAIYAQIQDGRSADTATVSDVCSHSIGVAVISKELNEVNHILIKRNSRIPCSVEEALYTTMADQASIRLTITEGEFSEMCDVTQLAVESINLPKGLPKGTEVGIVVALDAGQLLHLYVKIPLAGIDKEYTISRQQNMDLERLEELQGVTLGKDIL